jgi:uncharacterized protein (TIGR03000 family)
MRSSGGIKLLVAAGLALSAWSGEVAQAGDFHWHYGYQAWLRDNVMYGYPGARYTNPCPHFAYGKWPRQCGSPTWGSLYFPWGHKAWGYSVPVTYGCGPYGCGPHGGSAPWVDGGLQWDPAAPVGGQPPAAPASEPSASAPANPAQGAYCWPSVGVDNTSTIPGPMMGQPGASYRAPGSNGVSAPAVPNNSLLLNVRVPAGAIVRVNGHTTQSQGEQRLLQAHHLKPGQAYEYDVTAEVQINGQKIVRSQQVVALPGRMHLVVFDFDSVEPVANQIEMLGEQRATLKLHVPAEARVYVDGALTRTTGTTRTYGAKIAVGETRSATYQLRVEIDRKDQTLVRERLVSLEAGQESELTVDFDSTSTDSALTAQR